MIRSFLGASALFMLLAPNLALARGPQTGCAVDEGFDRMHGGRDVIAVGTVVGFQVTPNPINPNLRADSVAVVRLRHGWAGVPVDTVWVDPDGGSHWVVSDSYTYTPSRWYQSLRLGRTYLLCLSTIEHERGFGVVSTGTRPMDLAASRIARLGPPRWSPAPIALPGASEDSLWAAASDRDTIWAKRAVTDLFEWKCHDSEFLAEVSERASHEPRESVLLLYVKSLEIGCEHGDSTVVRPLKLLMRHPSSRVRRAALRAMSFATKRDPTALRSVLQVARSDPDSTVRHWALRAMPVYRQVPEWARRDLRQCVEDSSRFVAGIARGCLISYVRWGRVSSDTLLTWMRAERDSALALGYLRELCRMKASSEEVDSRLGELASNPRVSVRLEAIRLSAELLSLTMRRVPWILDALDDRDPQVVEAALRAVAQVLYRDDALLTKLRSIELSERHSTAIAAREARRSLAPWEFRAP